jgi:hypothetical protein
MPARRSRRNGTFTGEVGHGIQGVGTGRNTGPMALARKWDIGRLFGTTPRRGSGGSECRFHSATENLGHWPVDWDIAASVGFIQDQGDENREFFAGLRDFGPSRRIAWHKSHFCTVLLTCPLGLSILRGVSQRPVFGPSAVV